MLNTTVVVTVFENTGSGDFKDVNSDLNWWRLLRCTSDTMTWVSLGLGCEVVVRFWVDVHLQKRRFSVKYLNPFSLSRWSTRPKSLSYVLYPFSFF